MLSASHPLQPPSLSVTGGRLNGRSDNRRMSPTPSEQSFHTTTTHPASLFTGSQADNLSDSFSLSTTVTGDYLLDGPVWTRQQQQQSANATQQLLNYTRVLNSHPSFLPQPNASYHQQQQLLTTEKDLYEFLKEAQLEHYYAALTSHLKIRSVQQIKYVEDSDLTELGFSRPEQRRLRKYFNRECPQTAMGKLRKRFSRPMLTLRSSSASRARDSIDTNSLNGPPTIAHVNAIDKTVQHHIAPTASMMDVTGGDKHTHQRILSRQLELGSLLGEGEFGKVYQGVWRPDNSGGGQVIQVAVKVLESILTGPSSVNDPAEFWAEVAVMQRLIHPDIVRLHGLCIETDCVKIVMELAPLRSLGECLRESELRASFPVHVLHRFAQQICRAMSYLEEIGLVHQDLAARNVLVFTKDMVKVSDFGLSRALQLGPDYYQSNLNVNLKLPIAWCSPECIHSHHFTSASDVWAYGVTLWEMYTYGFTPWAGLTGRQVLDAVDQPRSARLDQPDACPDAVYDAVLRACWTHEPTARPTFSQLLALLPRLCPERWVTVREYRPSDSVTDEINGHGDAVDSHPTTQQRLLGPPLAVRANESVYVLGKRSSHMWKVVSQSTGQIGCVPTSVLQPYSPATIRSKDLSPPGVQYPSSTTITVESPPIVPRSTLLRSAQSKSLLRRASLTDISFRKTVSRLGRFGYGGSQSSNCGTQRRQQLTATQISLPQNDFRHVAHVGSDGKIFGEVGQVGAVVSDSCETLSSGDRVCDPLQRIDLNRSVPAPSSSTAENFSERISPAEYSGSMEPRPVQPKSESVLASNGTILDPLDTDLPSMGLDFGDSLLDEVFKCFSLENGKIDFSSSSANVTVVTSATTTTATSTSGTSATSAVSSIDTTDSVGSANNITEVNRSTVNALDGLQTPVNGAAFHASVDQSSALSSASTIHSHPLVVEPSNSVAPLPTCPELSKRMNSLTTKPYPVNSTTELLNCDSPKVTAKVAVLEQEKTAINSRDGNNGSSRLTWLRADRGRSRERNPPANAPTDQNSVRSKRSTFGSLTRRRSSSVSKVLGGTGNLGNTNKKLTISRPVLISGPTSLLQTNEMHSTERPVSLGVQLSSDVSPSMFPPTGSTSLLTLSSLGTGRDSVCSFSSRDSSLTIVSSTNDCARSLNSNGYDMVVDDGDSISHHTNGFASLGENTVAATTSLSPVSSPSFIPVVCQSKTPQPIYTSSMYVRSQGPTAAPSIPNTSRVISTGNSGIRAVRTGNGDMVFRAATGVNGLNPRRKFSANLSVGPMTQSMGPSQCSVGSRVHDYSLTGTVTNKSKTSSDFLTSNRVSSGLLARLDGLNGSRLSDDNNNSNCAENKPNIRSSLITTLNRRLSHSSSSSSSSNSPFTSPHRIEAVSGTKALTISRGSPAMKTLNTTSTGGAASQDKTNVNGSELDSFWGSTFADMLDLNRSESGPGSTAVSMSRDGRLSSYEHGRLAPNGFSACSGRHATNYSPHTVRTSSASNGITNTAPIDDDSNDILAI